MLANPATYRGLRHLGPGEKDAYSINSDKFYFVNGSIDVTDGTFYHGFNVTDFKELNYVLGPYPLYKIDVDEIAKLGCTAVINL